MVRRTLVLAAATFMVLGTIAGPAAAHHLVVDPPGGGQGPGEEAWVGGEPLPENAQGQGLVPAGPGGAFGLQSAAHDGGLNTACVRLRSNGNGVVDIHGPVPTTCHHGP